MSKTTSGEVAVAETVNEAAVAVQGFRFYVASAAGKRGGSQTMGQDRNRAPLSLSTKKAAHEVILKKKQLQW